MTDPALIRPARADDLDAILVLCAEHAAYEGASFDPDGARKPLGRLLFGQAPRVHCLVAQIGDSLVGYATYAQEASTWRAALHVHMDCLFVREPHRNAGLGRILLERVAGAARAWGCDAVEWQTPAWNVGAIRFYDRAGAVAMPKVRYRWSVAETSGVASLPDRRMEVP